MKWLSYWKTAHRHATELGCQIICAKEEDSRCDAEKAILYVDSELPLKQRTYVLLHELGHFRIHQREMVIGRAHDPHHFIDINGFAKISLKSRIARIREEILAWDHAQDFAVSLNIPLDKGFEMVKNKMLYSYLEWAVNKNNEEYDDNSK